MRIPEDVAASRGGASGLWAHGISGDLPIAVVRIEREEEREVARQGIDGQLRNKDNYTRNTGQDSVIYHEAIQSTDGCEKEKAGRNNDYISPLGNDR